MHKWTLHQHKKTRWELVNELEIPDGKKNDKVLCAVQNNAY